jgi:hypothetical protein
MVARAKGGEVVPPNSIGISQGRPEPVGSGQGRCLTIWGIPEDTTLQTSKTSPEFHRLVSRRSGLLVCWSVFRSLPAHSFPEHIWDIAYGQAAGLYILFAHRVFAEQRRGRNLAILAGRHRRKAPPATGFCLTAGAAVCILENRWKRDLCSIIRNPFPERFGHGRANPHDGASEGSARGHAGNPGGRGGLIGAKQSQFSAVLAWE